MNPVNALDPYFPAANPQSQLQQGQQQGQGQGQGWQGGSVDGQYVSAKELSTAQDAMNGIQPTVEAGACPRPLFSST